MLDVAELLSELDDLSERPPAAPRPVAEIRHRARRHRHRRRAGLAGLAGALVVVTVLGVVALRSDEGGRPDLDTGPVATPTDPDTAPPTTVDADGVVRVLEGRGLTLDPADGLDDGDRVVLTLTTDPGGPVEVTQCAAEVVGGAGRLDPSGGGWCASTFYLRDAAGAPDMGFEVARRLGTASGTVDCAAAPGRCALVARPMTSSPTRSTSGGPRTADARTYRYAPLVFRDDLPPPPEPGALLVGADEPVTDGQVVRIEASGFGRVSDLTIAQCVGPAAGLASTTDAALAQRCDGVRSTRVRTDDGGDAAADVRVFHDIGLTDPTRAGQAPRWATCSLCSLVVHGIGTDRVVLPLDLAPTDDPIRPVLHLEPEGPHRVDQQVRIEGSGFQVGSEVAVGLCTEAEPSGDAPTCGYPGAAFTVTDGEGDFVITAYPIPQLETGAGGCGDRPGACVLSWQRDGQPVGADVPLDISG